MRSALERGSKFCLVSVVARSDERAFMAYRITAVIRLTKLVRQLAGPVLCRLMSESKQAKLTSLTQFNICGNSQTTLYMSCGYCCCGLP